MILTWFLFNSPDTSGKTNDAMMFKNAKNGPGKDNKINFPLQGLLFGALFVEAGKGILSPNRRAQALPFKGKSPRGNA